TKILSNTEEHISTGIEGLDEILEGGYKRGSFVVMESGNDISLWGVLTIFAFSAINALSHGIHVAYIPLTIRDRRRVRKYILPFVGEEAYTKHLIGFKMGRSGEDEEGKEKIISLTGEHIEEDFSTILEYFSGLKKPLLTLMSGSTLEHIYRLREMRRLNEMVKAMMEYAQQTRALGNVTVVRVTPGLKITPHLIYMSSAYFKITTIDKTVIFYGVRPETGLYCLCTNTIEDLIIGELVPYV
ncbi:MAG: hypothetical protein ACXQTS_07325, partial [Candidatus Methanospirareceae archaeon]